MKRQSASGLYRADARVGPCLPTARRLRLLVGRLSLLAGCLPLALCALDAKSLGPGFGDRIVTDYYQAQPTATGGLDFYGLDGEQSSPACACFALPTSLAARIGPWSATSPLFRKSGNQMTRYRSALWRTSASWPVNFRYTLVRHSPFVECRIVLNYQQDIDSVFYETVETGLSADSAWVVTRDRREIPASSSATYVTDKWTTRGSAVRVRSGLPSLSRARTTCSLCGSATPRTTGS